MKARWQTDWSKCCLCQEDKSEDLKSPPTHYSCDRDGYRMIATNLPLFHAINALPVALDPARLDEGDSIEDTVRKRKARYHQSCRYLFNNTKLERARRRRSDTQSTSSQSGENYTKRERSNHEGPNSECFLCEQEAPTSELRHAMTMQLNRKLNECAKTLNDGRLLAKLSAGDAIAQELKYHTKCLTGLYNKERGHMRALERQKRSQGILEQDAYPLAFSELVTYMVETKSNSEGPVVFRLAEIVSLYMGWKHLKLTVPD